VAVDSKPAPQNIQDAFLNLARREKTTVTIYLLNGAKLLGRIRSFDKFSVLLESGAQEQLIFKHAISTISLAKRVSGELRTQPSREKPETEASAETTDTGAPAA
jgi:host factor-I protein